MEKTRIGLVGLWFERGNAYLTAGLRSMLLGDEFEPYVYARTGIIVSSKKGRTYHMETGGRWDVPNVERIESYDISPAHFAAWVKENGISAVIWNEETNHALIRMVKNELKGYVAPTGKPCLQIAYLDWVGSEQWIKDCSVYDSLLCATKRTERLYKKSGMNAHFFQWSVDLDLFKPSPRHSRLGVGDDRGYLFFHNAGWTGTNFRKGSLHVLNAWVEAFGKTPRKFKDNPNGYPARMLFHTQKPVSEYGSGAQNVLNSDPRIKVVEGTVTAPGLYHMGMVYLGPSRLEGLGLTFPEALASGMHVVTTNYAPMNEHGDLSCMTLLPVKELTPRGDRIAFPQADVCHKELAAEMKKWTQMTKEEVHDKCIIGRQVAEKKYDVKKNSAPFQELVRNVIENYGSDGDLQEPES